LLTARLESLQVDFERKAGRPFKHFFCPILHRDEPAELCRGHVINNAFRESARAWTIQRADVDGFYGSHFESEFVLLQERGRRPVTDRFADAGRGNKLRPEIRLDGQPVHYYQPDPVVPDHHTELLIQRDGAPPVRLALKLAPSEMLAAQSRSWDIGFERDLRLPALVSLLKAAHLTMFGLLGYEWGLSLGSRFIGLDGLGTFFDANRKLSHPEVIGRADAHFRQFINLVRPINSSLGQLQGTVSDSYLYMCTGMPKPWAFLVLIRTGRDFHGVLLPIFADDEGAARFLRFMENPSPRITAKLTKFAGDHWEVSTQEQTLHWPLANWE